MTLEAEARTEEAAEQVILDKLLPTRIQCIIGTCCVVSQVSLKQIWILFCNGFLCSCFWALPQGCIRKIFDHGKIWPSSMLVNALSLEFHWMRRLASRLHHRPGCKQWHWHQGVLLEKRIKLVLKGPKFRILYLKSWIAVFCFQASYNLLYLFAWRPFIVLRVCVSIRHVCKWWGLRASSTACTGGVSRGGQAAAIGAHNMSLFRFFLVGSRHRNLCSIFVEQNTTFVHSDKLKLPTWRTS